MAYLMTTVATPATKAASVGLRDGKGTPINKRKGRGNVAFFARVWVWVSDALARGEGEVGVGLEQGERVGADFGHAPRAVGGQPGRGERRVPVKGHGQLEGLDKLVLLDQVAQPLLPAAHIHTGVCVCARGGRGGGEQRRPLVSQWTATDTDTDTYTEPHPRILTKWTVLAPRR